jgi:hypothetical protein
MPRVNLPGIFIRIGLTCADGQLAGDEVCTTRRAARLGVIVGEHHALRGQPVEVGRQSGRQLTSTPWSHRAGLATDPGSPDRTHETSPLLFFH